MKAKPYQVNALIPQIKNGFRGALVFGADFGLIQEVSEQIARLITPDLKDSFCAVKISVQQLKETPSLLLDEGNTVSLMGGRRLLWIRDADNTIIDALTSFLNHIQTDAFILISAGNLQKNAVLRTFCESNQDILTIVCYADTEKDVKNFILDVLREHGITTIKPTALQMMVSRLNDNRQITRQELDKLAVYLGDKKSVDESDVCAVITDTSNASADLLCCAVCAGNYQEADRAYRLILSDEGDPVGVIRILMNHFYRLAEAIEVMSLKRNMEEALKKIMKPAQFRMKEAFSRQIQIWKKEDVFTVLSLLTDAERQAKSSMFPSEVILNRLVLNITRIVRRRG